MTLGYVARKALSLGVKVRSLMLAYYAGIATGCFLMVAWAYTLAFATPHAIALIERVQS